MPDPGPWREGIRRESNRTYTAKYGQRFSRGHRTRQEALQARAHLITRAKAPKAAESVTVASWAHRWLDEFARDSESTNRWHRERISVFVGELGDRTLDSVTIADAERFAKAHPSRLPSVKAMFNDAVRKARLIPDSPFRHVSVPKGEGRRRIVPLTGAEVDLLVSAAVDAHDDFGRDVIGPLITVAAWTGMRPGELYALEWRDLDWEQATVHVRREWVSRTGQLKPHTKNYLDRVVPLAPKAMEALRRVPREREFVFFTRRDKGRFQERSQRHYWWPVRDLFTERLPEGHWLKQRIEDGGKPLAMYELRHFFASELDRRGVPLKHVAAMLGHQDEGELARTVYVHRSEADAREAVRRAMWE